MTPCLTLPTLVHEKFQYNLDKSFIPQKLPNRYVARSDHLSVHPETKTLTSFLYFSSGPDSSITRNFPNLFP